MHEKLSPRGQLFLYGDVKRHSCIDIHSAYRHISSFDLISCMEQLIPLLLAAVFGVLSWLEQRRKTQKKQAPQPRPVPEHIPEEVEPASEVRHTGSKSKSDSAFDILGRVLTGDFSDFEQKEEKPAYDEFRSPARPRKRAPEPTPVQIVQLEENKTDRIPEFRNPEALRNAFIASEIISKPKALRPRSQMIR